MPDKNGLFAEFSAEPDQAKRVHLLDILLDKLHERWYPEAMKSDDGLP